MGKAHRENLRKNRGGAVEMGKRSLQALFSILHSGIPAPGTPCDWSILTVYVNHVNRDFMIHRHNHSEKVKKNTTEKIF